MLIVDSQAHIWGANAPERPWPKGRNHPHRGLPSFSKDDLLREMEVAGVDRVCIVPPGWEGERNDLALAAAQQHPNRFAAMGVLDIYDYRSPRAWGGLLAPSARKQYEDIRHQRGLRGLRLTFTIQGDATDEWIWAAAEADGVPIMMEAGNQLHHMDRIAQHYPALKLIIDRFGIPGAFKDDAAFVDMDKLIALAKHPNVGVKATALPGYTTDNYPYRRLHPYIRRVYDAFGPQRLFWGTDFTKLPSYRQAVTMYTEEMPWLPTQDLEWIMGRALCAWLKWELPSETLNKDA